ncbi:DUF3540 domain-containing protein [Variovorax sp.]|jgi:hypothetical protein|uniref:DUF3540 domain-containing protein n=1 Tax=Variovorax sp. TaxID=1871043 RepID=UPI00120DD075|nr:DUF3540 domain-containing protein [Variovorax sp.]TAJ61037.1 MAG: DUF3540 domain-containing protein [Variovorax sp.]
MSPAALRERASSPASFPAAHDAPDMQTLLRRPLPAPAAWTGNALGTVLQALHGDAFLVEAQAGGERWQCPRAASCLLQPSVGDTVLVAGPRRDQAYLIAVITQADPAQARLAVDGVLTLQAGTRLELAAPELDLQARKAQLEVGEMDYRGGEVRITTLIARFVGRTCETVLDRLSVLTRSSFRLTEEVEQVRAGQIDYQAEETLRLHAKNTLVSSKGLVKVDAEQIHMG